MDGKILLVEDDKDIQEMVTDFFQAKGINVACTDNGYEAVHLIGENSYQVLLLDVMIVGMNGFEVCEQIRKEHDIPIIFLTALEAEQMQLKGYRMGGDDYVTKPFSLPVLLAKVTALMQRYEDGKDKTDERTEKKMEVRTNYGTITVLLDRRQVVVDQKECKMADKEYRLLLFFMNNADLVLSREQILDAIWGKDALLFDRVVDKHLVKLRGALKGAGRAILTVPKAGYVLNTCRNEKGGQQP